MTAGKAGLPAVSAARPQPVTATDWVALPPPEAGRLSREERVLVARDVLARFSSRQKRFVLGSLYLAGPDFYDRGQPDGTQVDSSLLSSITGDDECIVCAQGAMFLASIDRFDNCRLRYGGMVEGDGSDCDVTARVARDWGESQAGWIEVCFEGFEDHDYRGRDIGRTYFRRFGQKRRRACLKAICRNIIRNDGIFIPEQDLPAQPGGKAAS